MDLGISCGGEPHYVASPGAGAEMRCFEDLKAGDAYPLGPIARGWHAGASMRALSLVSIVFYPRRDAPTPEAVP